MQKLLVVATGSAIAIAGIFASSAQAASFSNLYVFGDSLSDTGNVFNASGQTFPPSPPYFNGRFNEGPNWIDYLAGDLGLEPATFITPQGTPTNPIAIANGSINFAFGGATTGTFNTVDPALLGVQQQVGAYLQATNRNADPNALYVIWAGANDYLPTTSDFTPLTSPEQTIANLSFAINSLLQSGAENIAVANLPSLGEIPLTNTTPDSDRLNLLSQNHNFALQGVLNRFSQDSDANITLLDFAAFVAEVRNDPNRFGFTNATQGCLNVGCTNPDEFLFWDSLHPTSAGYRLLANEARSSIAPKVPEPSAVVGIIAFIVLTAAACRKGDRSQETGVSSSVVR